MSLNILIKTNRTKIGVYMPSDHHNGHIRGHGLFKF